ncbi:type II toxin-antitoxin system PemK/MazF family toxin [Ligilactobacillus sp. WILCCON 0076]|uniref:mRNA interferase n=1 Tax=Ligilactobacillus ubinensis TaxID=2876789 RepID=A0A9X2FJA4_9LACO|nr:type II toxin-antitoxin system PemK/MazF family toxin [Ligilactobacillus ubinensis]MCP0886834.1 type II toxin-antitoxin system PemK/MazF family toxin [Ligilactobacillus ubinensis]
MAEEEIKRGDIFYADLSPVVGSEQGGMRPVLVVQNNIGNKFSPTVIIAAITSRISKPKMPTHVGLKASKNGLEKDSVVLLEQVRTIDKQRLKDRITHTDVDIMVKVDEALKISVGLANIHSNR